MIFLEKDVLWLDISVEDAVSVHVVDGLQQLVHVVFDPVFRQVATPTFDGVVHVHIHKLEHQC